MGEVGEAESLAVRPMTERDLGVVLAIERASFSMPWTESTFRGLLRRPDAHLFVAEAGQEVVGYSVVWTVVDQAELGDIAVTEAWRGRGIGRLLLEAVLEVLSAQAVREVFLEVRPSNATARRLYEGYGFVEVGRRRNYYSDPREDALVLRRPL